MLNWQNLVPHRPLDENDGQYVPRPESDSRLAKLISVHNAPIAITGPVGSGKSAELAQAAGQLTNFPAMDPWLVRLDRQTDMRKLTRTRVLALIARALGLQDSLAGLSSLIVEDELARVRDAFLGT